MIEQLNFDLRKPQTDISRITMLLYGAPKIGKSTFCSRFQDHFFIATESGLNHLETRSQYVTDASELRTVIDLLIADRDKVRTVIIDTADRMCDMIEREILETYAIKSLADLGYGKGYALFSDALGAILQKITSICAGIVFVSHADTTEITTPTGSIKKWLPTLPKAARKQILSLCDVIAYAESEYAIGRDGKTSERRVLHCAPSQIWEAGDRTAKLPSTMPFAYKIFKEHLEKG